MPLDDDLGSGLGADPRSAGAAGNRDKVGNNAAAPDADDNADGSKSPAQLSPDVKMTRLAESFRCLEYKPGVRPWNAAELAEWVRGGEATQAQAQAAAFVLEVANMSAVWDGVPSFKMHDAALVWSKDDRAAFSAWIQAPWYL